MNVKETLIAARALIADKERWTTGVWARDSKDVVCDPGDPRSARWCAHGALLAVASNTEAAFLALTTAHNTDPARVNDILGHTAVLEMYDRAIERAT